MRSACGTVRECVRTHGRTYGSTGTYDNVSTKCMHCLRCVHECFGLFYLLVGSFAMLLVFSHHALTDDDEQASSLGLGQQGRFVLCFCPLPTDYGILGLKKF